LEDYFPIGKVTFGKVTFQVVKLWEGNSHVSLPETIPNLPKEVKKSQRFFEYQKKEKPKGTFHSPGKNILENDTSTCWVYLLIQNQSSFWTNSYFSSWTQPAIERLMPNFPLSNPLMEVDVSSSSLRKILLAQAFPKCESLIHQQHLTCESLGFSVFFSFSKSSKTHDLHIFGRNFPRNP